MKIIHGIGVSNGIAIGKSYLYVFEDAHINVNKKDSLVYEEKKRILEKAIKKTETEIKILYEKTKKKSKKEAEIFQAHLLFLKDPAITEEIKELMEQGFSTIASVSKTFEEKADVMGKMKNTYFRERAKDIRDVSERLIRSILCKPKPSLSSLPFPAIVVARDLTPSDTASLNRNNVLGFITEVGGKTSHTAILAEALGIPAVMGAEGIVDMVKDTKEGKRIEISANIGKTEEADIAVKEGAEGVGLFRTEFLFLGRVTPPTEEEQFKAYKTVLEKFKGKSVVIRTLDIGGDKQIPYLNLNKELNPFLGVRAIRICLRRKELFKLQLRSILRASAYGKVRIMYPMIAVKEEIEQANEILEQVKQELIETNIPFDKNIEVGIMVEIPSSALNATELIDYVDFFSIGTNDLTQYTFAIDRTNQNLNYLYKPLHPAMLRLIKMTIDASHKKRKWTGMCGELAGDPEAIPKLVEMGIDELSMSPPKIPEAKKIIRNL